MYYQEKVINGILHWKHSQNGKWFEFSKHALTKRLMEYEKALQVIQDLDNENEHKDPSEIASKVLAL